MIKKNYQKPDMTVYKLNRTHLLDGSPSGGSGGSGGGGTSSYIPRINEDMNELT